MVRLNERHDKRTAERVFESMISEVDFIIIINSKLAQRRGARTERVIEQDYRLPHRVATDALVRTLIYAVPWQYVLRAIESVHHLKDVSSDAHETLSY